MRILLYIVILAMLFLAPLERVDVAKLLPIEAVAVYTEAGAVVLETDSGDKGRGADAHQALQDLINTTPAVVYLDTAEFLLVSEAAVAEVESLRAYLKSSVKVCVCEAAEHVTDAVDYLEVHGNLPRLRDWNWAENGVVKK